MTTFCSLPPKSCKLIDIVVSLLRKEYDLGTYEDLSWFLGMSITNDREKRKVTLCSEKYINDITRRFNLEESTRKYKTPLPTGIQIKGRELEPHESRVMQRKPNREIIG